MDRSAGHHVMINKLVSDRKQSHYLTWTLDIGKGTEAGGRLLGKKNGCKEQERGGGGKSNESTLYACKKMSEWNPLFYMCANEDTKTL